MGMFDDIRCEMDLPETNPPCPTKDFQTKSFENPRLRRFVINAEGEFSVGGNFIDYHGVINFYDLLDEPVDGKNWFEYSAKFTNGRCVEISVVEVSNTRDRNDT